MRRRRYVAESGGISKCAKRGVIVNYSESMESRTGAVQRLVEENFDRFVAIKAATFNVYDEMKLGPLAPEGDYSIADLKESLKRE